MKPSCDIVFVLPHLGPGGAQRVASMLLSPWQDQGLNCKLVTLFDDPPDTYSYPEGVERFTLFPKAQPFSVWRFITRIRRRISKPHQPKKQGQNKNYSPLHGVLFRLAFFARARSLRTQFKRMRPKLVVSFLTSTNVMSIHAARDLPIKVIISERNDPRKQFPNPVLANLREATYAHAHLVSANTKDALAAMEEYVPRKKMAYIPNPVVIEALTKEPRQKVFLTVGRLVDQKQQELLIRAFGLVAGELPDWSVDIVGEGPNRARLETLSKELSVGSERIRFLGHVSDPFPLYRKSAIFVLPSHYEGMPNALMEAMAFGVPSIAIEGLPGPVELLSHGRGLLAPANDAESLAQIMKRLALSADLRIEISQEAKSYITQHDITRVNELWSTIFRNAGLRI